MRIVDCGIRIAVRHGPAAAAYRTPLADRSAFTIPSSAGQVIQVGASRRDLVRARRLGLFDNRSNQQSVPGTRQVVGSRQSDA